MKTFWLVLALLCTSTVAWAATPAVDAGTPDTGVDPAIGASAVKMLGKKPNGTYTQVAVDSSGNLVCVAGGAVVNLVQVSPGVTASIAGSAAGVQFIELTDGSGNPMGTQALPLVTRSVALDGGYEPTFLVNPPTQAAPWYTSPEFVDGGYPPAYVVNAPTQATPWYTSPEFVDGGYSPSYVVNQPNQSLVLGPPIGFTSMCHSAGDGGLIGITPNTKYVVCSSDINGSGVSFSVGAAAVYGQGITFPPNSCFPWTSPPSPDGGSYVTCAAQSESTSAPVGPSFVMYLDLR
jgi:hypothetical protein